MKKIYVAASVTHAPENFKDHVKKIQDLIRAEHEVLDFYGLKEGDAKDVYKYCTDMVKECDAVVADCSHPAIGVGIELLLALHLEKPVLAVAHKDAKVGRMVLGITDNNFIFKRYESIEDIKKHVKNYFS